MQERFVVYLTTYFGDKLPPFYIGSTTETKALSGKYFGSIRSKRYREIFESELNSGKDLFCIRIMSYHNTREEALAEELNVQKLNNVVQSERFFNESYASVNGYFGRSVKGKDNHSFGKTISEDHKSIISKANKGRKAWSKGKKLGPLTEERKRKISDANKGKKLSEEVKLRLSILHTGKKHTEETKQKISKLLKGRPSPNKGRKHTDEAKKNMSEAHKGQISWNKGVPCDDETKKKIILAKRTEIDENLAKELIIKNLKGEITQVEIQKILKIRWSRITELIRKYKQEWQ